MRKLLRAAALVLSLGLAGGAQALVLAVNEGVTYRVGNDEIRARYAPLVADLAKLLGQPVTVEPVSDYPTLRKGLTAGSYDLALVHPAHISIAAIKSGGYRLVAVTKGWQDYSARFFVAADSPVKSLAELSGRKLGAPDEDSITSWMVRATLRDVVGAGKVAVTYTRYQDAVPFMVENTFTQAGATASGAVIKQWTAAGGRVIGQSKAVPIKHVIASSRLSPEQVERVREYLLGLDASESGRKKLAALKVQGYMAYDPAALLVLGTWLGL